MDAAETGYNHRGRCSADSQRSEDGWENVALREFGNGMRDASTPRRPERRIFPLLTYVCQFDGLKACPTGGTKKGRLKDDRAEQQVM